MFEDLEDFTGPHTSKLKLGVKRIFIEEKDGSVVEIEEPEDVVFTIIKELHPGDVFGKRYVSKGSVNFTKTKSIKFTLRED
jgi:hypothetical protein